MCHQKLNTSLTSHKKLQLPFVAIISKISIPCATFVIYLLRWLQSGLNKD
jgi:hypothetical protein